MPKLHSSEEEYYSKSQKSDDQDDGSGDQVDLYDSLPYAEN